MTPDTMRQKKPPEAPAPEQEEPKDEGCIHISPHGWVRVVGHYGSDETIDRAARASYDDQRPRSPEDVERLVRYLARERHTTPFEMTLVHLHVKAPIFVARQWMRHRTGAFNEVSGRYVEAGEGTDFWVCPWHELGISAGKQGREGAFFPKDTADAIYDAFLRAYETASESYEKMLRMGVAREIARAVMPLGMYTTFYWKVDLHNLAHFIKLRRASDAQREIQHYALAIEELVTPLFPVALPALLEPTQGR
jgi:thymidylate synthase (FAD)